MKKLGLLLSVTILLLSACSTHSHVVGDGPQTGVTETARQYYVLFGLVPLNKVDTNSMIGGATDYKLETGHARHGCSHRRGSWNDSTHHDF